MLFGNKSVGTILKNAGENEKRHWGLDKKQRYMARKLMLARQILKPNDLL
jgi:hypothetical protein